MKSSNYYKKLVSALSLLLLVLLLLASCSGETPGGDVTDPPAETTGGSGTTGGGTVENAGGTTSSDDPADPSTTTGANGETEETPSGTTGANGETEEAPSTTTGGNAPETVPSQTPGTNPGTTPGGTVTTPTGDIDYTVKVTDGAGSPMKAVIVKFFKDGTDTGKMAATSSLGVAKVTLPAGTYTFTLKLANDADLYTYNEGDCLVTATAPNATVVLLEKTVETPGATEQIFANEKDYNALLVGETNGMVISIPAGDMLYVVFEPTREGLYTFSATANGKTIDCGYYGGTFNVLASKVDGGIPGEYQKLNVKTGNLGGSYVLGFKTADGSATEAMLTIARTGDSVLSAVELIPWTEIGASSEYLTAYTGSTSGTLTSVDISSASTKLVKGSDGYYHLGDASGPVVMFRLESGGTFLAGSISDMANNGNVAHFVYEGSTLVKKNRYNEMIADYLTVANDDGVVPLNDELITMIKGVGVQQGWWDKTDPRYLFDEDKDGNPVNVVDDITWMFLCCYYK